jgi:hypothetical protein
MSEDIDVRGYDLVRPCQLPTSRLTNVVESVLIRKVSISRDSALKGRCVDITDWLRRHVICTQPHEAEFFAWPADFEPEPLP